MSIFVSAALEVTPSAIDLQGGATTINIGYAVGGVDKTRACDRILVGGVEQTQRECFPVTGTLTFLQRERRQVTVTPRSGVDFIEIRVLVREVDANNGTIAAERVSAGQVRINAV